MIFVSCLLKCAIQCIQMLVDYTCLRKGSFLTSSKGVASSCLLLTAWMSSLLHITRPLHHWIFQWKHLKSYSIAIFYSHCLDIFCTVFAKIEHCRVFYTVPLTVMASWLLSRSYRIEHFLFLFFFFHFSFLYFYSVCITYMPIYFIC